MAIINRLDEQTAAVFLEPLARNVKRKETANDVMMPAPNEKEASLNATLNASEESLQGGQSVQAKRTEATKRDELPIWLL